MADRESVLAWLSGKPKRLVGTAQAPKSIVDALVGEGHVEWLTSIPMSPVGYVRITMTGRRWLAERALGGKA